MHILLIFEQAISLIKTVELEVVTGYLLDSILDSLQYNAPDIWIDSMSLDTFLSLERSRRQVSDLCSVYVPMQYHHSAELPDEDEIQTYNRQHPSPNNVGSHLLSTLVHHMDHFFGVFVDPAAQSVYVFGQHVNKTYIDLDAGNDWQSWRGPHIVDCLCQLHGIPTFTPQIIIGINWEQPGGTECGAECGETLLVTQGSALLFQADGVPCRPSHRCTHRFRLQMLLTLHETASVALVSFCSSTVPGEQDEANELRSRWLDVPTALEASLNTPMNLLRREMALCARCQHDEMARRGGNRPILPRKFAKDAPRPPTLHDLRQTFTDFSAAQVSLAIQALQGKEVGDDGDEAPPQMDNEEAGDNEVVEESMLHHRKISLNRDASAATYRKFPHPIPTPVPPTIPLRGRRLPFEQLYDAYDEGPSLLATRLIPEDFGFLVHPHIYTYLRPSGIEQSLNPNPFPTEWADFGYRLLPDFAQTFDITESPWLPGDHLFPRLPDSFAGTADYEDEVDCLAVSLADFNHRTETNSLLPLTGVASRNPTLYLRIDPELDAVEPDHIHLDCDIDLPFLIYYGAKKIKIRDKVWERKL